METLTRPAHPRPRSRAVRPAAEGDGEGGGAAGWRANFAAGSSAAAAAASPVAGFVVVRHLAPLVAPRPSPPAPPAPTPGLRGECEEEPPSRAAVGAEAGEAVGRMVVKAERVLQISRGVVVTL